MIAKAPYLADILNWRWLIFRAPSAVSVEEAVRTGLLDERAGTFRDPGTGRTMPVSAAVSAGLLALTTAWPTRPGGEEDRDTRRTDLAVTHQRRGTSGAVSDARTEEHMVRTCC